MNSICPQPKQLLKQASCPLLIRLLVAIFLHRPGLWLLLPAGSRREHTKEKRDRDRRRSAGYGYRRIIGTKAQTPAYGTCSMGGRTHAVGYISSCCGVTR
jgi:hypothetical protein